MVKCINCAWFPWKPGADTAMLPLAVCSPKIGERKWFKHSPKAERDCPEFEQKEQAIAEDVKEEVAEEPDAVPEQEAKPEQDAEAEVVKEDAADTGVKDKDKKAPKRANTGKRKSK